MKTLFTFLCLLVPFIASAQGPIYRNSMTTNQVMNAPSSGDVPVWNVAAGRWSNGPPSAASITNFPAEKQVWVDPVNGVNATAARGNQMRASATISNAIVLAQAGDSIRLVPGTYSLGTNHAILPHSVSLIGTDPLRTFVSGTGGLSTNGPVVQHGSTSIVDGVKIIQANKHLYNQAAIGSRHDTGGQAPTNSFLQNLIIDGESDGIYYNHTNACYVTIRDCEIDTKWHGIAWFANSQTNAFTNSLLRIYGTRSHANLAGALNPTAITAANSTAVVSESGRVEIYNCDLLATNADQVRAVSIGFSLTIPHEAVISGSYLRAAGSNDTKVVDSTTPYALTVANCNISEEDLLADTPINWVPGSLMLHRVRVDNTNGLTIFGRSLDDLAYPDFYSKFATNGGLTVGSNTPPPELGLRVQGAAYVNNDLHVVGNSLLDGSVTGQSGSTWLLPIVSVTQTLGVAGDFDAQGSINTNIIHNRTEDQVGATNDMILVEDVSTATVKRIALGNAPIDWANITGMPAGFADGADDSAGTPGGNTTEIQFNFGGAFAGTNMFTIDRTNNRIGLNMPAARPNVDIEIGGTAPQIRLGGGTTTNYMSFSSFGSMTGPVLIGPDTVAAAGAGLSFRFTTNALYAFTPLSADIGLDANAWRTGVVDHVKALSSLRANGDIITPWELGANGGTVTASTAPQQLYNLFAHTNLNFVPLTGTGDNSNSVKILVRFRQNATGGFYPTNNAVKLEVKTNANAVTETVWWYADGVTNVSVDVAITSTNPASGQFLSYDEAIGGYRNTALNAVLNNLVGTVVNNVTNVASGWGIHNLTASGTLTTTLTNRSVGVATNTFTLLVDFSDAANKQIYNITQFSTNAITIATTNLVLGRTICVYMSSNMVTYTVTVADTLASAIQWNFNVATNGATSFTKTNSVAARLYLTAETNGVVSAELGYYRK